MSPRSENPALFSYSSVRGTLSDQQELIADNFAGGGGASMGIHMGLGRAPDIAINHDATAVAMHAANHPDTLHFTADVFEIDPREVTKGRSVGLAWFSPDCTHFSKARGSKPYRDSSNKRRSLCFVLNKWRGQVRPRVMMMENVEEFRDAGPLIAKRCKVTGRVMRADGTVAPKGERTPIENQLLIPDPKQKGRFFRKWLRECFTDHGYTVEHRELRAFAHAVATIRKRLYIVARCDGKPVVWPDETHGNPKAKGFGENLLPWKTIADCIDWSTEMLSVFATKKEAKAWADARKQKAPQRPLADNSMRRIARGVMRYVVNNPTPFIVGVGGRQGQSQERAVNVPFQTVTCKADSALVAPIISPVTHGNLNRRTPPIDEPLPTITCAQRGELSLVAPFLTPRYGEAPGQEPRCRSIEEPGATVVNSGNGDQLVAAHLLTYHSEKGPDEVRGGMLDEAVPTIDCSNRYAISASFLVQNNGGFNEMDGRPMDEPLGTVLANGRGHHGLIAAHMVHSNHGDKPFSGVDEPARTIVAGGQHHALVAAHMQQDYGQSVGYPADEPGRAVTAGGGGHQNVVASFLAKYYGQGTGQEVDTPLHTIPCIDRFGLVNVTIEGQDYYISDIAMRMLKPRELYRAQGFPDTYIIDRGADGRPINPTDQVRMCGNSVCPPVAAALASANCPELIVQKAAA